MNDLAPYLGFASVSLMVALSPGPSWVYTISTTLGQGRRAGMVGNLGNSTGILCHGAATALGLAALLQYSAMAFFALKVLGAAYLVYLALRSFRSAGLLGAPHRSAARPLGQVFRTGALVSLTNPKISLLMLALLPQFIDPAAAHAETRIALMGAMHAIIAGAVHTLVVGFSGEIARRLKSSSGVQRVLRWASGCLFLGFGVRLALAERP